MHRMVYFLQSIPEVRIMFSFSFARFTGYGFCGYGLAVVRA